MTRRRQLVTSGRLCALYELEADGREFAFEELVRPPGVRVIALTDDRRSLWLTTEFRAELDSWDLRVPGGKVFDEFEPYRRYYEDGESLPPELITAAAVREFSEEVGFELLEPRIVGVSPAGATVHWPLYFVTGTTAPEASAASADQHLDDGERIMLRPTPVDDLLEIIISGGMSEERSAVWLLRQLRAEGTL